MLPGTRVLSTWLLPRVQVLSGSDAEGRLAVKAIAHLDQALESLPEAQSEQEMPSPSPVASRPPAWGGMSVLEKA